VDEDTMWLPGSLSPAWLLVCCRVGVVSYATLSLLARAAFHSPEALHQLQAEVIRWAR
jgi:hypothetical protein